MVPFYASRAARRLLVFSDKAVDIFSVADNDVKRVAQVASPYPVGALAGVRYMQLNDVLFLVHPAFAPMELRWLGEDNYSLGEMEFDFPPMRDENVEEKSLAFALDKDAEGVAVDDGVGTLTADFDAFSEKHIGAYYALRHEKEADSVTLSLSWGESVSRYWVKKTKTGTGRGQTTTTTWEEVDYEAYQKWGATKEIRKGDNLRAGEEMISAEIEILGDWDVATTGYWYGNCYVDKWENGGWKVVRKFHSESDKNASGAGKVEERTRFRLRFYCLGDRFGGEVWTGDSPTQVAQAKCTLSSLNAFHTGVVRITDVIDARTARGEVLRSGKRRVRRDVLNDSATEYWSEGAFSDVRGWPRVIAMHDERMFLGAPESARHTLWFSQPGDYYDYEVTDDDATGGSWAVAAAEQDGVHTLYSLAGALHALTESAEFTLSAKDNSPAQVGVRREHFSGAADGVSPVFSSRSAYFVGRQGKTLLESIYQQEVDGFAGQELDLLARHISARELRGLARAALPEAVVFAPLSDGDLAVLVYDQPNNILGWGTWSLGGCEDGARVEDVASVRGAVDDVFALVSVPRVDVVGPQTPCGTECLPDIWGAETPDEPWVEIFYHPLNGNDSNGGTSETDMVKTGGRVHELFASAVASGAKRVMFVACYRDQQLFFTDEESKRFEADVDLGFRMLDVTQNGQSLFWATNAGGGWFFTCRNFIVFNRFILQLNTIAIAPYSAAITLRARRGYGDKSRAPDKWTGTNRPGLVAWGYEQQYEGAETYGARFQGCGFYDFNGKIYNWKRGLIAESGATVFFLWDTSQASNSGQSNHFYMTANCATITAWQAGRLFQDSYRVLADTANGGEVLLMDDFGAFPPTWTPPPESGTVAARTWALLRYSAETDDAESGVWLDFAKVRHYSAPVEFKEAIPWDGEHLGILALLGEKVTVVANGGRVFAARVGDGALLLVGGAIANVTRLVVGRRYEGRLQTQAADVMLQDGSSALRKRRVVRLAPRFAHTVGGAYGPDFEHLTPIHFGTTATRTDTTLPAFDGMMTPQPWTQGFGRDGSVCVAQTAPLPMTLLGVAVETEVGA
jgi:hypothetical protein